MHRLKSSYTYILDMLKQYYCPRTNDLVKNIAKMKI